MTIPDLQNLQMQRRSLGLSQQELAQKAGVSQSLIAKIEARRIDPSLSNAQRIAKALAAATPKELTVRQVMVKHILSFPSSTPVLEAVKAMRKRGISQFPVIENNLVVGRITEGCILEHVEKLSSLTLKDIMLPPPPQVDKETPLSVIMPLLQAFSAVLVLENGHVVGIVTKADVMGAAIKKGL
jgi:predicted transcriptional regulator